MESKQCPYCDKLIEGYNEKHVEYLFWQHLLANHREKTNFKTAKEIEDKKKNDNNI